MLIWRKSDGEHLAHGSFYAATWQQAKNIADELATGLATGGHCIKLTETTRDTNTRQHTPNR